MDRARLDAALPAYQIGERIGRRGLGVVFAARHRRIGLQAAIKVLADGGADEAQRERSLAEATALGELDHPHIVRIHDYVERDGLCLLVMERLTGGTLEDRPVRTPADACGTGLAVADALSAAHQRGVLHRDLKPENLLYSADGTLKVVGFGFAKTFDGAASLISASSGPPAYLAPERIQGTALGPATDLYSLGVLLFELFSGRLPFSRELPVASLLHQHLNVPAPPLIGVPPELAAVVARALRKAPQERQPSADEFEMELAKAATVALGPDWLDTVTAPLWVNGRIRDAARALAPAGPASLVGPVSPVSPAGWGRAPAAGGAPPAYRTGALTVAPVDVAPGQLRRSRRTPGAERESEGQSGFRSPAPRTPVDLPPRPAPAGNARTLGGALKALGPGRSPRPSWYRRRWMIGALAALLVTGVALVVLAPWKSSSGPSGQVNVASPRGLVVDAAGNLYLTDVANHEVLRIGPDGTVKIIAGTGAIGSGGDGDLAVKAQLSYPGSVALGPWGSLYIADTAQRRIRQVTSDGRIHTVVGGDPTSSLADDRTNPQAVALPDSFAIATSPAGQLYIVDSGSATPRVRRLDGYGVETVAGGGTSQQGGSAVSVAGSGFGQLTSVAVGSDGRIYLADKVRRLVWVFRVGGVLTPFAGYGTAADCPSGIVAGGPETISIGATGALYVGSYGLCKVGTGTSQELVSGRYIDSVAVAPNGDVYFISQNQIYKRIPAGTVIHVAD